MNEFKLGICDDQQCFIDDIKQYMKAYESESRSKITILEYHSGDELLKSIDESGLAEDILFLDVEMPGKLGTDVAKEIRKEYPDVVICFITAYDKFAYRAYQVQALGYLVKPTSYIELRNMLNRCILQVKYQRDAKASQKSLIEVKTSNNSTVFLDISEILYVEKRKNQCVFHLEDGELLSYMTLKQASQLLDEEVFYKVHQGYIVNFGHIKEVKANSICLGKNREVPVSRRNQEKLRKLHMDKIQKIRQSRAASACQL